MSAFWDAKQAADLLERATGYITDALAIANELEAVPLRVAKYSVDSALRNLLIVANQEAGDGSDQPIITKADYRGVSDKRDGGDRDST